MNRSGLPMTGVLSLLALLGFDVAFAQRTTATVYGNVQDSSGAVLQDAQVTMTSTTTGAVYNTTSDERGDFTVGFLPVGSYTLTVEAKGFKTYRRTDLEFTSGQELRLTVPMELGAMTEQVVVQAEAPLVQNASVTLRDTLSTTQVMELPQARRNITALLSLQNGIRDGGEGRFQFNGLASGGSTITVDGTDASGDAEQQTTSMYQNFNFINVISQEAVQEVQVSKGVMTAEVARTFGGNINVVTKSGTNQFHGTLFENFQNDLLNARYSFLSPTAAKPPIRFNQFGGSFGGPAIKDKLFFFGTYEGYRQTAFQALSGNVPTREFRAQAIAAVPAYQLFLDRFPSPTESYAPGATTGLFLGAGSTTASENHAVARVDYNIGSNDRLAVRYTRSRPQQVQPRVVESNSRLFSGMSEVGNVNYTKASSSWTSESRFGINMMDISRLDGIWTGNKVPGLSLTGGFSDSGEGLGQGGYIWSLEEVFAKTVGRHSLKAGGIFLRRTPGRWNEEVPVLSYQNVADFLANRPVSVTVTFGTTPFEGRSWETGVFFQDDFRVSPRLILNLGLRYEYFGVYKERDGRFFNPDGPVSAVKVPPVLRSPDSAYNGDFNNFTPRVGFAWNLDRDGKNVVRGGIGTFVAPFTIINFQTNIFTSLDIPFRSVFSGSDLTSLGLKYPVYNTEVTKLISGRPVPRGYLTFDPNNPNPYNVQWTLDYQRQLTSSLVLQTGYTGNKAMKITASNQFNLPDRFTNVRPYPDSLQFVYQDASDFSYYHAWQTSLRKRFSGGLMFNGHYTWARAMSIGGGDFTWAASGNYQDENNWRADKGPANLDVRHRFVSDLVYEAPIDRWFNLTGAARTLLAGWQISGILNVQSGSAFQVSQSNPRPGQRADYIGGSPYANGADPLQFLNTAAFARVPVVAVSGQTARPGTLGKNSLRGPGLWTTNLALGKNFHFSERVRFQIRGEAFNAFNHVNYNNPTSEITSPTFGRILGAGQERRMQLSARFSF